MVLPIEAGRPDPYQMLGDESPGAAGPRLKEGRKAGVLIGLEHRDGPRAVWVRSPCLPPNTADVAETD